MTSVEQEEKAERQEVRRHSENLFWAEYKPLAYKMLGVVLFAVTLGVAFSGMPFAALWALFPLAGSLLSFKEVRVAENEYALMINQASADIEAEQWGRNFAREQVKEKVRYEETGTAHGAAQAEANGLVPSVKTTAEYPQNMRSDNQLWSGVTQKKEATLPVTERNASLARSSLVP